MADTHKVSFTINPRIFGEALSEAQKDLSLATGNLFVAAAKSFDSEVFDYHGCAPTTADQEHRVILGLQGEGRNYCFVDVPAREVHTEGAFVIGQVDKLKEWSKVARDFTKVTYKGELNDQTLRLEYKSGHDEINVMLFYRGDNFSNQFQAHNDRFYTPETPVQHEDLADMIKLAGKIAPTDKSTKRSGDLVFSKDEDGNALCEFYTRQQLGKAVVATNQRQELGDYPFNDFEWEVAGRHLSLLRRILAYESVTANVHEEREDPDDESSGIAERMVQFGYEMDGPASSTFYVHRQCVVRRDHPPINNWSGREEIFGSEHCKLFGTVTSDPFIAALKKTWALKNTKLVEGEIVEEDGHKRLQLHTFGSDERADKKLVQVTAGDSEIESYYFMPSVEDTTNKIVGDAKFMQIRSFPLSGREAGNGYVLIPVSEEADDPSALIPDPSRYMIVNWQDN